MIHLMTSPRCEKQFYALCIPAPLPPSCLRRCVRSRASLLFLVALSPSKWSLCLSTDGSTSTYPHSTRHSATAPPGPSLERGLLNGLQARQPWTLQGCCAVAQWHSGAVLLRQFRKLPGQARSSVGGASSLAPGALELYLSHGLHNLQQPSHEAEEHYCQTSRLARADPSATLELEASADGTLVSHPQTDLH